MILLKVGPLKKKHILHAHSYVAICYCKCLAFSALLSYTATPNHCHRILGRQTYGEGDKESERDDVRQSHADVPVSSSLGRASTREVGDQ